MKKWGDAKMFLFEDLLVYSALFLISFSWDFLMNFLYSVNLLQHPHEPMHPYSFGLAQLILMLFSIGQLYRTWQRWRYYA